MVSALKSSLVFRPHRFQDEDCLSQAFHSLIHVCKTVTVRQQLVATHSVACSQSENETTIAHVIKTARNLRQQGRVSKIYICNETAQFDLLCTLCNGCEERPTFKGLAPSSPVWCKMVVCPYAVISQSLTVFSYFGQVLEVAFFLRKLAAKFVFRQSIKRRPVLLCAEDFIFAVRGALVRRWRRRLSTLHRRLCS